MSDQAIPLVAYLIAKPGQEDALIAAVTEAAPLIQQEPGCLEYAVHVSRKKPGTLVFYEVWTDKAALDAHAKSPAFTKLSARFPELLAEPLRIEALRRIA